MSFSLNHMHAATGTRFRIHVQSPTLDDFVQPETIYVSSPAGSLGPGPSDHRMYAIQPKDKKPYDDEELPPYRGEAIRPALPGPDGHFDHLRTTDAAFPAAHMFGTVRRVLDVWETYLNGPIPWHFGATHPVLELIPHVPWNNAHFGWGFMECGEGKDDQGIERPFALNFDVLAHETGHGLIFSIVGMPDPDTITASYRGFHESASDCVAMISALHFDSFIDHVLRITGGNLYLANEMNRIGELSHTRQIRVASNSMKLTDVIDVNTPAKDITGKQVHAMGQPLTGAVFDLMMEFALDQLVAEKLVKAEDAAALRIAALEGRLSKMDTSHYEAAFQAERDGFREALYEARDMIGLRLAETWRRLSPHNFAFGDLVTGLLEVDGEMTGKRYQQTILECFQWRGIAAK